MSQQRSSDIVEQIGVKAMGYGGGGLLAFVVGLIFFIFRGGGVLVPFSIVLMLIGLIMVGYAIYCTLQVRKVASHVVECVYCHYKNRLTEPPANDFMCGSCYRMIPVLDGHVLPVQQVRCGFCNELNYYNQKTQVLLCESCNHEIPISQGDDMPQKHSVFAVKEDTHTYELVLMSHDGHHTENLITALQSMLALNRNHVKDMLDKLPVTLLTGIPRMKAEMLQAQLAVHGATAEFRAVS